MLRCAKKKKIACTRLKSMAACFEERKFLYLYSMAEKKLRKVSFVNVSIFRDNVHEYHDSANIFIAFIDFVRLR